MNLVYAFCAFLLALILVAAGVTRVGVWMAERKNPPSGSFATVNDTRMHFVRVPAAADAPLPPIVFVHGASGNLRDAMLPLRKTLEGRADMLFVDRPGHGWSARGPADNATPAGQAKTIAALMDHLEIGPAIVVGHSFGGAIAATFALDHPQKTAGLVFLAAVSHPWPGAGTAWYYELTATPLLGRLFSETLALPGGALRMAAATACVFAPNRLPEGYAQEAGIGLVLRPGTFRANAQDVTGLYDYVTRVAPRYGEIDTPTVVISGRRDTVVYEEIHSTGLARDIPGARAVWIDNLGHKPDWTAPDLTVAAIETVAGLDRDLAAAAREVEVRIADDAFGPIENCPDEKPPLNAASR
ncbi:alpha/beta fold hydrolase [Nitratireductor alexandrii]|uniref:alpha/beta fold hydrolase n=1 Tax=Nitratireductor alexandrii TaxID=2448161 RepID=UPI000FDC34B4|nr:alpha/beta hydrolase [Nitratireductor alexandrii]